MATLLDGNLVNSYPSTKRASVNKLLTENSVTRVINRLIDNESYVITSGLQGVDYSSDIPVGAWANTSADFEFVIHGYYFSIAADDYPSGLECLIKKTNFDDNRYEDDSEHTLYARIFIDRVDPDYPELYGQQNNPQGEYMAIRFYIDDEALIYPEGLDASNSDFYDAPLVKWMANDAGSSFGRFVPITSLFKFRSASISNIDGGEVIL